MISKIKNTVHGLMLLMILMVNKLLERFMKKELRKTNPEEFRINKVIKKK